MSLGVVTPGMPLVTHTDVAEWEGDESSAALQTSDAPQLAGIGDIPAEIALGMEDTVVGDDQMHWGQRLEAANSQAEKLLVLAKVIHSCCHRSKGRRKDCATGAAA